jgi:transcriptional regulator with XRE-family HTH domain
MELLRIFGRNVREARKRAGLTQEELAHRAAMKRSYLSDLERGTRNPTIRALGRLAAALEVTPDQLLRLSADRPGDPSEG